MDWEWDGNGNGRKEMEGSSTMAIHMPICTHSIGTCCAVLGLSSCLPEIQSTLCHHE